ncbi:hypothetical protein ASE12_10080 [Aeromicrobium sp. Root236]|uniref:hypothetical protein n=1 Tax=Aeromicrobium sp. Root236 TaxID=1736498 RepID=UPI0007004BDC|nr:hypothetical protein [Aeromicrobium sp. Root236]KRC65080.1 hypothetical protein ASE12_10080 [Aeromicrobium sp. Root236]
MRVIGAALVLAMAVALAACGSDDQPEPDRVRATLLQPSDLPSDDPVYNYPTQPGGGGHQVDSLWTCLGPARAILEDTGYVRDYVAYDLHDQGRVYSFRFTNKDRDVASDFDDLTTAWRTCDELGYQRLKRVVDPGKKTVTEVDHGPDAFGFRTSDPSGDVYGETAFRVVGQSIIQVTAVGVEPDIPTEVSVTRLLEKATTRAE